MRKFLGAAAMLALVASPVLAQTTPSVPNTTTPGTVLQPSTADTPMKAVPGAPLAGANSFTESQAKARIEANGFSNVSGLKKDDGSIWRGTAMKDGKSVSVALDYQGNIVVN